METSALVPLVLVLVLPWAAAPSSAARALSDEAAADALPLLEGTVHDLLPNYGLPRGLLPASVTDYSMDGNGKFEVKLAGPCYIQFTDLVYYDRTIRGTLSYGQITDLSGIQVKKLFAWLPITGMVVAPDGKGIEFQVGFLSETLPASMFAEIPTCRKKASSCSHGDSAAAAAAVEVA